MEELKSQRVTSLTGEAQTRRGKKRLSATSKNCKTRRTGNSSDSLCSSADHNSAVLDSDDDFGEFVARELKLIDSVRAKQFAKLQIHSILFNVQFDIVSAPREVIHSVVASSLNSSVLPSALDNNLNHFLS